MTPARRPPGPVTACGNGLYVCEVHGGVLYGEMRDAYTFVPAVFVPDAPGADTPETASSGEPDDPPKRIVIDYENLPRHRKVFEGYAERDWREKDDIPILKARRGPFDCYVAVIVVPLWAAPPIPAPDKT